jgi:hypothetical protein
MTLVSRLLQAAGMKTNDKPLRVKKETLRRLAETTGKLAFKITVAIAVAGCEISGPCIPDATWW